MHAFYAVVFFEGPNFFLGGGGNRRELKLEGGGSQIVVKLWNEHAQINVREGQRVVVKNV